MYRSYRNKLKRENRQKELYRVLDIISSYKSSGNSIIIDSFSSQFSSNQVVPIIDVLDVAPWLLLSDVKFNNAVINIDDDCDDSNDRSIIWDDGIWLDGSWIFGIWNSGIWLSGEWYSGNWLDGEWFSGIWHGGEWHTGKWHDGYWMYGYWYGGTWLDGDWHDGNWYDGTWLDGDWCVGVWYKGDWKEGRICGEYSTVDPNN